MRSITIEEMEFIAGGYSDYEEEIQQVRIVGQRELGWWDQMVQDVSNFFSNSFATVGVISPVGVGGALTVTSDRDVLYTGLIGTPGPVLTVGVTPGNPSDYLVGAGAGANIPAGFGGIAAPISGDGPGNPTITIGTPGVSVGVTVNVADAARDTVEASERVYNEADRWGKERMGITEYEKLVVISTEIVKKNGRRLTV